MDSPWSDTDNDSLRKLQPVKPAAQSADSEADDWSDAGEAKVGKPPVNRQLSTESNWSDTDTEAARETPRVTVAPKLSTHREEPGRSAAAHLPSEAKEDEESSWGESTTETPRKPRAEEKVAPVAKIVEERDESSWGDSELDSPRKSAHEGTAADVDKAATLTHDVAPELQMDRDDWSEEESEVSGTDLKLATEIFKGSVFYLIRKPSLIASKNVSRGIVELKPVVDIRFRREYNC